MKKIEKVAVVGLGALGCAYASKLHDANPDGLTVLAGGERARRYQERGFYVNGKRYDFVCRSPGDVGAPADFILVAVKTHQLDQAIEDMRNLVGTDTIILSILNGITSEEILGAAFGAEKLLYGTSYALTANREDNRISFPSYGTLAFGEAVNKAYSPKVLAVQELLERCEIPYVIPENMLGSLWWKFMVNVGINQCSAVTRGRYGLFQTVPEAKELMEAAMDEVIQIAGPAGVQLGEDAIARWYEVLNGLDPSARTSMLEDVEGGRRTEVDSFAGTVCALGNRYGVATPVNQTLLRIIKAMEHTLS